MPKPQKGIAFLWIVLACFCFSTLTSEAQTSQWTGPDASNNIYNNNTGYVGIGINTPQAPLHVYGGILGQTAGNSLEMARIAGNNGNGAQLRFLLNRFTGGNAWWTASTRIQAFTDVTGQGFIDFNPSGGAGYASLAFGNNSSEYMRILNNGFVGIATTTPQANFESSGPVLGQAASNTSEMARFSAPIGDYGQLRFSMNRFAAGNSWVGVSTRMQAWTDATAQGYIEFNPNGNGYGIALGSTNGEVMRLLATGNVLIGKTSQINSGYMLDVNGNARANEVVVNTTGADYVFDPGYHLTSLDELDNYIRKEHHLPGIASAAQMQQEGLNIGDNQTRLLAKIEELSLYLIEQEQKIRQLEERNRTLEDLEKRIERLEQSSPR